jgi:hypothetical protein
MACQRRVAFGQQLAEKMMSCGLRHCAAMLDPKINPSRAWLCSMAQVESLEATGS